MRGQCGIGLVLVFMFFRLYSVYIVVESTVIEVCWSMVCRLMWARMRPSGGGVHGLGGSTAVSFYIMSLFQEVFVQFHEWIGSVIVGC